MQIIIFFYYKNINLEKLKIEDDKNNYKKWTLHNYFEYDHILSKLYIYYK